MSAKLERVLKIADAILYEGYLLYPYRSTAHKNRQRWHFGVLYPRAFCERENANDAWTTQTQCLMTGVDEATQLRITARFLQMLPDSIVPREASVTVPFPSSASTSGSKWRRCRSEPRHWFEFPGLNGAIDVSAETLEPRIRKLTVRISNQTRFAEGTRDAALGHSLISTHSILTVRNAQFVSAIDPPEAFRALAAECRNIGSFPVLMGGEGECDTMLSAPIILYDHPKVAEQSPGDHFDCTEIDEMLALRILTLTDQEKEQMRQDVRTRALLERTEALSTEQLANLHGIVRSREAGGHLLEPGERVRLRPKGRSDIFDMALNGMIGIVESVERDFENRVYVAVTIEDDPGRDLGRHGQPGHRFFFGVDEIEPL